MNNHKPRLADLALTRRDFLCRCGMGMGAVALANLMGEIGFLSMANAAATDLNPLAPRLPHFAPRAKRVIHLFMNGGPSHVDTFDPKPLLDKYHGKPIPGQNLRTERKTGTAFRSPFAFKRYGKSGIEVSELFQHTAGSIDDVAVVRSM